MPPVIARKPPQAGDAAIPSVVLSATHYYEVK